MKMTAMDCNIAINDFPEGIILVDTNIVPMYIKTDNKDGGFYITYNGKAYEAKEGEITRNSTMDTPTTLA